MLEGFTEITGFLGIDTGVLGIVNLKLEVPTTVAGNLLIVDNGMLESIDLSNSRVEDDFNFSCNNSLCDSVVETLVERFGGSSYANPNDY